MFEQILERNVSRHLQLVFVALQQYKLRAIIKLHKWNEVSPMKASMESVHVENWPLFDASWSLPEK
jgi:hypothetical protein